SFQEFLILPVLTNAMHETGIHLDVIQAKTGKFLEFREVVAKVIHTDTAAEFFESMAKVMECFKFAENAKLRHFNPEPAAKVRMLAQQIDEFIAEFPGDDSFNREIDRELAG